MRRRGPYPFSFGCAMIALGIVILLALVLPSKFWWFLAGAGLVAIGVCLSRRK